MTREQAVLYAEAQENTPGYHAKREPVRLMQMTPTLCLGCGIDPDTEFARMVMPAPPQTRRALARRG